MNRQVGFCAFWAANSILAVALLVLPRRMAAACIAVCLTYHIALNYIHGPGTMQVIAYGVINMAQATLAAWLTRRALGANLKLRTLRSFVRLMLLAVIPACLAGGFLVAAISLQLGTAGGALAGLRWILADAVGMGTILSTLLLLVQPARGRQRSLAEHILLIGGLGCVAFALMHQVKIPTAAFLTPFSIIVALRLGPKGASIGSVLVAAIALPVVLHGSGPFQLHPEWSVAFRGGLFQAAYAVSFALSLTTAFAVADNTRMRELLVHRQALARDARRRALAANKAKTEFLATMSHEIRTPMNSMLGFTQVLLRRTDLAGEARRQLELIASAGDSLLTVVNDILDLSKVEAGRIVLDPRPTDIGCMSRDALAIIEESALAKGLSIDCRTKGLDGLVLVDDQRLCQVLLNLLNNAVKFTAAGRVELRVEAERRGDLEHLRFEVADTGIGVAPAMLDQLFVRFSQGDSSIARSYGGTGLGLAICKRMVELMGGVIGVDSTEGAGSVFWFELDLPRAEGAAPAAPEPAVFARHCAGRVLLVDDHPMNRELGVRLLEIIGCTVDTADCGEQAVAAVRAETYDLVLMDVHMPGMDGLAATRAIRALFGEAAAPPIVAMTADVLPERIAACLDAGMVGHLAKPIDIPRLHATVLQWLEAPALSPAAPEPV